ncbi:acyl-CoA synthetase [Pseudoblastomonas halimionae]|uniref:AMP-binding protein n=1 Tax=Alteriqipengyuania halimionae TaxID=1926630 RepID=A0A6I4U4L6_9SPHN|nr:acyl-CoA synthetase [Alteriqipengyuania halimionae]MXP10676.1 AMP-binding protein [Alteriqipengyuania halimionae]
MHPSVHAASQPDKPALIMAGSCETLTYAELEAQSNRVAQLLRDRGVGIEDPVAICLDNDAMYYPLAWGINRAGGLMVAISNRLTAPEICYILKDSGAKLLFCTEKQAELFDAVAKDCGGVPQLRVGGEGERDLAAALSAMPTEPIADERAGSDMLYSSGTTGQPKGVRLPLPDEPELTAPNAMIGLATMAFGIKPDSVYLSPAPLYHAAPLRWSMTIQRLGGTVVVMEKFDPERALAVIEEHEVTDAQFVPTHFVRMLKLPGEIRAKYDASSLRCAIHAAAPCPVPVKEAMIDWWGPVLFEYYAGTEGNGFTFINSTDWQERKGSVGKAVIGTVRICDEHGDEVLHGEEGQVFFSDGKPFSYHNDPDKTADATNKHGWTSLGDVGRQDEDGFLYLTDRKSFMIISGGVNIYPQEIENLLVTHDKVADAAVIGAPDDDLGEKVVAVVQPVDMALVEGDAGEALEEELCAFLGERLSRVKMPRQIDFRAELPREPTGKLYKRLLRDEYRDAAKAG